MSTMQVERPESPVIVGGVADRILRRTQPVSIAKIDPNPHQPLDRFNQDVIDGLKRDMHVNGFRGSIELRRMPDGRYQTVAGHHRLEAWKQLGHKDIPAQIVEYSDLEMALSIGKENVLRRDLNIVEEADLVSYLQSNGMTIRQIADAWGKSKGWVQNRIDVLKLSDEEKFALRASTGTMTELTELAKLPPDVRELVAKGVSDGRFQSSDLRALNRAYKNHLRRLESTVPDEGRVNRVGQAQLEAAITDSATLDRKERMDEQRWETLLERAQPRDPELHRAIVDAAKLPPVRENPVDNPEGQALGLTVEPSVETWEALERELDDEMRADSERQAEGYAAGFVSTDGGIASETPTKPLVMNEETHWVNPRAGESTEQALIRANEDLVHGYELRTYALRKNLDKANPQALTAEQRERIRANFEEYVAITQDILG